MIRLKSVLLFGLLTVFLVGSVQAQNWTFYRHELMFGIGASNFMGELGGANREGTNGLRDFEFSMTRPNFTAGYSYLANPYFRIKGFALYGRLKGDDKLTQERYRNNRNLHFRSPVIELGGSVEYYPWKDKFIHPYRMRGTKNGMVHFFSPYISAGIGGMWFNPKAQYTDGKWYALKPLSTEGQGLPGGPKPYSRLQIFIPVGLGVKYALSEQWSIGFEISRRFVFTDYLDDVSTVYYDNAAIAASKGNMAAYFANPTLGNIPDIEDGSISISVTGTGQQRGDEKDNDSYMFAIFSVHYRLLKGRLNLPKF